MGKTTAYSALNVSWTLDGQAGSGLWDGDDAISIDTVEDDGTLLVGADGDGIFSQSASQAVDITIRLQHTSPAHRLLHQKLARQRTQGVRLAGFPVHIIEVDSGEGGSSDRVFVKKAPADQKGKNASVREWVLTTASWKPTIPRRS